MKRFEFAIKIHFPQSSARVYPGLVLIKGLILLIIKCMFHLELLLPLSLLFTLQAYSPANNKKKKKKKKKSKEESFDPNNDDREQQRMRELKEVLITGAE